MINQAERATWFCRALFGLIGPNWHRNLLGPFTLFCQPSSYFNSLQIEDGICVFIKFSSFYKRGRLCLCSCLPRSWPMTPFLNLMRRCWTSTWIHRIVTKSISSTLSSFSWLGSSIDVTTMDIITDIWWESHRQWWLSVTEIDLAR